MNQRYPFVPLPHFQVVVSCRDGQLTIPMLARSLQRQKYPRTHFRTLLIADNCTDRSADIARVCGLEVYTRSNLRMTGKGYALNEVVMKLLRHRRFDAVVLLDIDAQPSPDFLYTASESLAEGPQVLQGASLAMNAHQTSFTRLGVVIQGMVHLYEEGRNCLGLSPLLIGSHGIVISRDALKRLDWRIAYGKTADDLELGVRCALLGIRVSYVKRLVVANELCADARSIRRQRSRWTRNSFEVAWLYGIRVLKALLRGNWRAAEYFFSGCLLPSFANLFLLLSLGTGGLVLFSIRISRLWFPWTTLFVSLWAAQALYFVIAFLLLGVKLESIDWFTVARYLGIRGMAFIESLCTLRSSDWRVTVHGSRHLNSKEGAVRA